MNSVLAKTVEVHQKDWPQRLACVVAAYNANVHESTGYSPNFLIFCRELAVPVDAALGNPPADILLVNDYADHLVTSLQEANCDVRKHLGSAEKRAKRYYDCKSHPLAFKPGDLVYATASFPGTVTVAAARVREHTSRLARGLTSCLEGYRGSSPTVVQA